MARWCAALLLAMAVVHPCAAEVSASDDVLVVPADPLKGFNYPYVLRLPHNGSTIGSYLLVAPNNTGKPSDDLQVHQNAAEALAYKGFEVRIARKLNLALLVPVFPRPRTPMLYTHLLNRRTMLVKDGPLQRVDIQLIRMIEDARRLLLSKGIRVEEKVLLAGFSASGSFVNRYVFLHPDRVKAAASGSVSALMLPVERIGRAKLSYPLGLSDFRSIAGHRFQLKEWKRVPQLIYVGANDTNDAVPFDDAFTEEQRRTIYATTGRNMLPERWNRSRQFYERAGSVATFRAYEGVGHGSNEAMHQDVLDFFRQAIRPQE